MQFIYIINDITWPKGTNVMDTPVGLGKQEERGVSARLYVLGEPFEMLRSVRSEAVQLVFPMLWGPL